MFALTLITAALAAPTNALESTTESTTTPPPRFESDAEVRLQGESNDVYAAAGAVYVDEPIGDNAFLAGEQVYIESAVRGDLFAVGETLHINAPVNGDVYALVGGIEMGPEGRIDGHLLAGGGELNLDGPIGGSVTAGAGQIVISAPIGGDVLIEAGELLFRDGGQVGGDLSYTTPEVTSGVDAFVDGDVSWTEGNASDTSVHGARFDGAGSDGASSDEASSDAGTSPLAASLSWALWTGWSLIGKLIVGAVLLLLGGGAAARIGRLLGERPSQSLGFGVAGFVLLPAASLVACAMLIPLPLGLLGLLTFVALLYISQLIAAQALGDVILRRFRPDALGAPLVSMAVGLIPLVLLSSLPGVGALVWFVATALGGGAIGLWLRELARA